MQEDMRNGKKYLNIRSLFIIIMAVTLVSAIICIAYFEGTFLPDWAIWQDMNIECSETEDGIGLIELKNRRVTVYRNGESVWSTDRDVKVQKVLYSDVDHDGENELLILNYKIGRYGFRRPFWDKGLELGWYQHIYIYRYDKAKGRMRPLWMASDINVDAADFTIVGDGVVEITDKNNSLTHWAWKDFGLKIIE